MPDYVIGLDVGGTRVKSGAVTRKGELLQSGISKTPVTEGPKILLKGLEAEVREGATVARNRRRRVGHDRDRAPRCAVDAAIEARRVRGAKERDVAIGELHAADLLEGAAAAGNGGVEVRDRGE